MRSNGETEEIIRARVEKSKYIPSLVVWGQQDQVNMSQEILAYTVNVIVGLRYIHEDNIR